MHNENIVLNQNITDIAYSMKIGRQVMTIGHVGFHGISEI